MRKIFIENVNKAIKELPEFLGGLVDLKKSVQVYRNLHKNCYSVRQGGIVRFHTNVITLKNVTYKVSEAGRQRVIREQRKNVHAVVVGKICHSKEVYQETLPLPLCDYATYNPYKCDSFYVPLTGEKLLESKYADLYIGEPIIVY